MGSADSKLAKVIFLATNFTKYRKYRNMNKNEVHAVTGAFGYSGRYIATRLLEQGRTVITLTNSVDRTNPFGGRIRAVPLSFGEPDKLAAALAGVDVLYNTYWVRFNHGMFTHGEAVENTLVLFDAARRAGVRRVVHVSITNPSEDSPLEYFAGKARLERALRESGLSSCDPSANRFVRARGHPHQQHRLGAPAVSIFCRLRRWFVSASTDSCG